MNNFYLKLLSNFLGSLHNYAVPGFLCKRASGAPDALFMYKIR
ncbi:hypothetical protein SUBVAR_05456 [Subdoligranulum variabile DSM 15176]|uniref:Uncharacterized protein n=1 Tax=Subdoligranulum variabile DSM 15176 TaxID=411471 RepID=D1PM97_9FIRM|nr:hypothetical protein SUBVAR_05456 [Subdoligranulum variabile DSM 15176]